MIYDEINENKSLDASTILMDYTTNLKSLTVSAGSNGATVVNNITIPENTDATLYTTQNAAPSVKLSPSHTGTEDYYVSSFSVGIGDAEATQQNRGDYAVDGTTGEVTGKIPSITDNANVSVGYSLKKSGGKEQVFGNCSVLFFKEVISCDIIEVISL